MSGLDIAIIATCILSAVIGYWRGLVRPVIGLGGFLAGLVLAATYSAPLAEALWPGRGAWSTVASYALIMLATLVVTGIIASLVSRAVHMSPFGTVDRLLGLTLATLLVIAGWAALLWLGAALVPGVAEVISDSTLAPLLFQFLPDAGATLPHSPQPA